MNVQSLSASLYESICSMHRRNRTVASAYDTPLTALESTTLPEIVADPGINLIDLKVRLHLDQVSTTRLIQGLVKSGVVTQEKSKHDRRFKEIRLTPKGKKLFELSASRAFTTFQSAFERVPRKQQKAFGELFAKLNDALGAEPAAELPGDPGTMSEVRRISRVLGLLSRDMFGHAECSPLEWHTLDLLAQPEASSHVVDLADLLGAPTKTLAALVQRLATKGLIKQSVNSQDNRYRTISLTPAGRALHRKRRTAAEKMLGNALLQLSARDRGVFTELFSLYAGMQLPAEGTVVASSLLLRRVTEEDLLPQLRSFIYRERAAQKLTESSSSDLLGESSVSYAAWVNDKVIAVASFVPTMRQGTWRLSHLVWSESHRNSSSENSFVQKLFDQFAVFTGATTVVVSGDEISQTARPYVMGTTTLKIQGAGV
jgi:DNA-binding MarR family transcriptional regulator